MAVSVSSIGRHQIHTGHNTPGPTTREVPEDGRPSSAIVPARSPVGGEKQADAAGSEGGASAVRRGAAGRASPPC